MKEQPALFTVPEEPKLTVDQQLVWDSLQAHADGLSADEVGAIVHASHGKHVAVDRCEWCGQRGLQLLRSKALAPLVIRRKKTGLYEPRNPDPRRAGSPPPGSIDPATAEIPF